MDSWVDVTLMVSLILLTLTGLGLIVLAVWDLYGKDKNSRKNQPLIKEYPVKVTYKINGQEELYEGTIVFYEPNIEIYKVGNHILNYMTSHQVKDRYIFMDSEDTKSVEIVDALQLVQYRE